MEEEYVPRTYYTTDSSVLTVAKSIVRCTPYEDHNFFEHQRGFVRWGFSCACAACDNEEIGMNVLVGGSSLQHLGTITTVMKGLDKMVDSSYL